MPVCYQFAEKGTCRFGDSCRFEHIPHAPVSKEQKAPKVPKARKVVDQHRPVPDHIVAFFSRYPEFDYDSDLSFIDEFYRMCDHFGWRRYSNERDQARDAMRRAMVQQFNHTFGTNAEDLASWQKLCEIIQIDPIPDKLKQCRRAVVTSHINICDLLDAPFLGTAPTRFPTEVALSVYTRSFGKIFPRDEVEAGSLLEYLLRHILNPRPERGIQRGVKGGRKTS
ncbi:hypothetical protein K466DRAFT_580523 [Polyporus arcularius HHB13444]|uniref:C3H1-type domain-containing protein n=1 Tax=Polyporus arcularius HHB13444 TaxID=1314778 RepID=A0A5C3PW67_9APHY|nr:hypothetical protein K466DRAFT_580523 [Polyporus arcularius HHB13444]